MVWVDRNALDRGPGIDLNVQRVRQRVLPLKFLFPALSTLERYSSSIQVVFSSV